MLEAVGRTAAVATVRISYAEARAAFARLQREAGITRTTMLRMVHALDRE